MVELEAHERFNKSTFPISLVSNDKNGGCIKRLVEVLSKAMKVIIGLIELFIARGGVVEAGGARGWLGGEVICVRGGDIGRV